MSNLRQKSKPIIFSPDMAQAIAEGWKTQKRCIYKDNAECHYGGPGDLLWVREPWQYADWTDDGQPYIRYSDNTVRLIDEWPKEWDDRLKKIWADLSVAENYNIDGKAADRKWRDSWFMPKWATRLMLKITAVRPEQLLDISEADASAEGFERTETFEPLTMIYTRKTARDAFLSNWVKLYGLDPVIGWAANPWVWVITFEKVEVPGGVVRDEVMD